MLSATNHYYYFLSLAPLTLTRSFRGPSPSGPYPRKDLWVHDGVRPSIDSVVGRMHAPAKHEGHLVGVANLAEILGSLAGRRMLEQTGAQKVRTLGRGKRFRRASGSEVVWEVCAHEALGAKVSAVED